MDETLSMLQGGGLARELGFGSFGRAYAMRVSAQSQLEPGSKPRPPIVIKEIDPSFVLEVCGVRSTELILQEAMAMQRTRHPNLVRTFSVFVHDSKLYQIQEFCPEGNLQMLIEARAGRPMSEPRIQHWFGQIASALTYLHEKEILHCAIKSQNILLSADSTAVKLSDPGTAHLLLNSQKDIVSEAIRDTLLHYPPEVFDPTKIRSVQLDVWMMGVVVYQLATLELPFPRGDGESIRQAIMHTEPKPLDSSHYTEGLRDLVTRMLNKDQDRRCSLAEVVESTYLRDFTFATGLRRVQRPRRSLPSSDKLEKQIQEIDNARFQKKWAKKPTKSLPFKCPSSVRALLLKLELRDKFHSVIVVCADGEILNLAPENYERVEWRAKVFIPINENDPKDKFGIFHAAFDEKSDRIFIVLVNPHREHVYYIRRGAIAPDPFASLSSNKAGSQLGQPVIPVQLQIFTPSTLTQGRQFWGLTVDTDRRLLFAGTNKDITVWSLAALDTENKDDVSQLLVGVIRCDDIDGTLQIEPRYCAITSAGGQGKLAISDFVNNRVCVFYFNIEEKQSETVDETTKTDTAEGGKQTDEVAIKMPNFDTKTVLATKKAEDPYEVGSVYGPCDLFFDAAGGLIVSEYSNKRAQIFSFRKESTGGTPKRVVRPVWFSDKIEGGPYRIVVAKGLEATVMLVGQHAGKDIISFQ